MARSVLFVHGGGGGAFEADAKLAASLRQLLGAEHDVRYPQMPDEENPDYETWVRMIGDEIATMGSGPVIVGHSIGASVVVRALVDGRIAPSVAGIFLVAAPFWHDHEFWRWNEVALPDDAAERIPAGTPLFFYHGRDDDSVPVAHVELYARALPHAAVRRLDGRDHQLGDDLTDVARDILCLG